METKQHQQKVIETYISAYNCFDTVGMLRHLHQAIYFENVSGGEVNLTTQGREAFERQAEKAKSFFLKRAQKIRSMHFREGFVEVPIDYTAVLAVDLPNGLKAGETIHITGKPTFGFKGGKINFIRDES